MDTFLHSRLSCYKAIASNPSIILDIFLLVYIYQLVVCGLLRWVKVVIRQKNCLLVSLIQDVEITLRGLIVVLDGQQLPISLSLIRIGGIVNNLQR